MAYFANGSEGECFDKQCSKCKYGDKACPIALVQSIFNYSAVNNSTALDILDCLVKNNGECEMYKQFESDFKKESEDLSE